MDPIQVYQYEFYDPIDRRWKRSDDYATQARIEAIGGVKLAATVLVVDPERLDEHGVLERSSPAAKAKARDP